MPRPTLELSMIVKNAASSLARCLESARPWVDEIIIGDTGSTDQTVQIARRYGAQVLNIPWENNFAQARNSVLAKGRCDWVLILDADEMLDSEASTLLPSLISSEDIFGYEIWKWNYVHVLHSRSAERPALINPVRVQESRDYPAYTASLNTLLFRRHPEIFFEYRVHESIAGRLKQHNLKVAQSSLIVHHFGFVEDSKETRAEKNEFYQRLGREKIHDNPNDYWAHFELGLGELEHYKNPSQAIQYFKSAITLEPRCIPPWIFAGICLSRLLRWEEALSCFRHAEQLGARSAVLSDAIADVFFHQGDYFQAQHYYEEARNLGGLSALVECKLGATEVRIGRASEGLRRIQDAIKQARTFGELYDILVASALGANNVSLAAEAAESRLAIGSPSVDNFLLAAALRTRLGDRIAAQQILKKGLEVFPFEQKLHSAKEAVEA
jgi:glycosyltransferase involved in cell wall biosynthesis